VQIAGLSGNRILSAVSQAMLGWLFRFHSDLLIWSGHEDITLAEHAAIVDAIEAGDVERAAAEMGAHLDRSTGFYKHHPG
jgi:DNA-binding FadR family transcriptional regulator